MNKIFTVSYGNKDIEFELRFSNRKTLGITVNPDLSVIASAPENSDFEKIEQKIKKRAKWILNQQKYFQSFLPVTPEREYISGETHLYLGKQFRLSVFEAKKEKVCLNQGWLEIHIKNTDNKGRIKALLTGWYSTHAEKVFKRKIEENRKLVKVESPEFEIKRMSKRWGSCTAEGKIILNPEIIKAPSRCIDYVIIHELCHLIHHKHNKEFYQLQSSIMPDWEKWKDRLEKVLI